MMREHFPKFFIIGLLALIVGVPILLRPANSAEFDPDAPKLVIYTPHNEQIRFELENAFNDWRVAKNLPEVVFDWRTPGGTSDIRKSILSQFTQAIDAGKDYWPKSHWDIFALDWCASATSFFAFANIILQQHSSSRIDVK